jgi:hypothetical protein
LPCFRFQKNPITPSTDDLLRPVIWLNAFEFSFSAYESSGNPEAQVLRIKNSGKSTLQYSVSDDADWLSVEPGSGVSSGQLIDHTLLINKAGLSSRDEDYTAAITITSSEAYNNPQRVSVSLNISVEPPPEIWVSSQEMTFAAKVGTSPPSQTLRVKNGSTGTLTYDLAWKAPWLNVSPAGGTSRGEEKSHNVSVDSEKLTEGTYEGTITVTSDEASNSPERITINLEISGQPPPPTDNRISIACGPASGGTGTFVSVPISIRGNLQRISTYGLEFTFDSNLFQYQGTSKGTLTGSWAVVDGNVSAPGTLTIGGFAGSASAIPAGSVGTIAVVSLRVTGAGYSDGHQSQVTIRAYSDDISGCSRPRLDCVLLFQ